MNVEEKNLNKHFAEKSHSVFEGLKGGPLKHTKTFFLQHIYIYFIVNIYKKSLCTSSKLCSRKYAGNKKERNY